MKNIFYFLIIFCMSNCNAQRNPFACDFFDRHRYRMSIFNTGFITQTSKQEPYTGNLTGFTNPLN